MSSFFSKPESVAGSGKSGSGKSDYFKRTKEISNLWKEKSLEVKSVELSVHTGDAKKEFVMVIGRASDCDICLKHVSVSLHHAYVIFRPDGHYIQDNSSTYGTFVNGIRISNRRKLNPYDIIQITNTTFLYNGKKFLHCTDNSGVQLVSSWVSKVVNKNKVLLDRVDLRIEPGEFVAIVGCSGAGKTTYLNCISGYSRPTSGQVLLNGVDLYENFGFYKSTIGYVPQQDTVYKELKLEEMLRYSARLRLPSDTSDYDIEKRIFEVMKTVGLHEKRDIPIKRMSGGQIKRASIAVELLADPGILFLDEPTSGLDPGMERDFMKTMRKFSEKGKTVILVTHSTQSLHLCDKIVFLGNGGKLCFFGTPEDCLTFFETDDYAEIYDEVITRADYYRNRYYQSQYRVVNRLSNIRKLPKIDHRDQFSIVRQWMILQKRYVHLISKDTQRILLLLIQAPVISVLLGLMIKPDALRVYNDAKSTMFVLVCASIWIGCSNTVQEVCKERAVLEREYKTNLHISAYIFSKVSVMFVICTIQSILLIMVLFPFVDWVFNDLLFGTLINLFITAILCTFSSAMMGLLVSSVSRNADRAMGMVPLLLIPQILFSGILFEMNGIMKGISGLAISRWGMQGYGTALNFNALPTRLELESEKYSELFQHSAEKIYDYTVLSLTGSWLILSLMAILFMILSVIVLKRSLSVK